MSKDLTVYKLEFPNIKKLDEYMNKRYSQNFHIDTLGRLQEDYYKNIRENIDNCFKLQDEILVELFKKHSDISIKTTFLRVKLLNEFYSTNVPDVCIYTIARKIANNSELYKLILKPANDKDKKKAVDFISTLLTDKIFKDEDGTPLAKEIYSFATKFCHFSNPMKFSIYDQYVAKILRDYIKKHIQKFMPVILDYNKQHKENEINTNKPTQESINKALKDYEFFIKSIDMFIALSNVSDKHIRLKVDNYLWLAGMMKYRTTSRFNSNNK